MLGIISPTSGLDAIPGARRWYHLVSVGIGLSVRFFYFGVGAELEGGLTAGPLLLPGNPGTLVASELRP